jgi:hypothetical protein
VGTLLAQSSLRPKVLGGKREGVRPDFLIEAATLECAVEVSGRKISNRHGARLNRPSDNYTGSHAEVCAGHQSPTLSAIVVLNRPQVYNLAPERS